MEVEIEVEAALVWIVPLVLLLPIVPREDWLGDVDAVSSVVARHPEAAIAIIGGKVGRIFGGEAAVLVSVGGRVLEDWLLVVWWSNVVGMTAAGGELLMAEAAAARKCLLEVACSEVVSWCMMDCWEAASCCMMRVLCCSCSN